MAFMSLCAVKFLQSFYKILTLVKKQQLELI